MTITIKIAEYFLGIQSYKAYSSNIKQLDEIIGEVQELKFRENNPDYEKYNTNVNNLYSSINTKLDELYSGIKAFKKLEYIGYGLLLSNKVVSNTLSAIALTFIGENLIIATSFLTVSEGSRIILSYFNKKSLENAKKNLQFIKTSNTKLFKIKKEIVNLNIVKQRYNEDTGDSNNIDTSGYDGWMNSN
ncbi:hypothetical protein HYV79_05220 [Candidatus Woesearchaeota archaeon]|nr:hypothetical protein [Candidatus Woesearchaeota archaeon]